MRRLIILFFIMSGVSCSTSKYLSSDVKPAEINDMLKIEPFSYISLIEQGNRSYYNDSISQSTKIILNQLLDSYKWHLRLSSIEVQLTDYSRGRLEEEISFLLTSVERNKSIKYIQITPLIDSLLRANNKRFGLIVVQNGFTRAKGNYGGQVAKAVGLGILTGVLTGIAFYETPIKANSTLYAMIVDNREKNIAFYHKSSLQDKEPTERTNFITQINNIFGKYFWRK